MPLLKRDASELRFNSLMLLPKQNNPDYYTMLFRNAKAFFYGMQRPDLSEDLDYIIKEKIEKIMGANISSVLLTYKNLPTLNSFTRSKLHQFKNYNIYKYTIQGWLDEIENWIFQQVIELEPQIRFLTPARQWV